MTSPTEEWGRDVHSWSVRASTSSTRLIARVGVGNSMVCLGHCEERSSARAQGTRSGGGWRSGNRDETAEQVEEASKKGALADQLELHCPTWCPLIGTEHTTCGWSARRGAVSVPIHWILKT